MWTACIRGERADHRLMGRKVSAEAPGLGGAAPNEASACHPECSPWSQVWFRSWQQESVCVRESLF